MFKTALETLEIEYTKMGETLLGSLRPFKQGGWHWLYEDANCVYMRNPETSLGLLGVFNRLDDGGVSGTQFYFNAEGILGAFDVALSKKEIKESGVGGYVMALCSFEQRFDPEREVSTTEKELFWSTLEAPIRET